MVICCVRMLIGGKCECNDLLPCSHGKSSYITSLITQLYSLLYWSYSSLLIVTHRYSRYSLLSPDLIKGLQILHSHAPLYLAGAEIKDKTLGLNKQPANGREMFTDTSTANVGLALVRCVPSCADGLPVECRQDYWQLPYLSAPYATRITYVTVKRYLVARFCRPCCDMIKWPWQFMCRLVYFWALQYLHCLWVTTSFTVSVLKKCIMLCWTSYAFHSRSLAIQAKQFYLAWLCVALRRRESWHGGYTEVLIVKSH